MKGKITLIPVDNPVKGLFAIDIYKKKPGKLGKFLPRTNLWPIHYASAIPDAYLEKKEIGQIVIEYDDINDADFGTGYHAKPCLPLHPEDWKYALEHIGEEIEFKEEYWNKDYSISCINPQKWMYPTAKLIHSTPEQEYFDAHIGNDSSGKNHLRKYFSLICSNCCNSGINFKITNEEFDRFKELLANDEDKPTPIMYSEEEVNDLLERYRENLVRKGLLDRKSYQDWWNEHKKK